MKVSAQSREMWSVFLTEVSKARAELKNPAITWYRGHTNAAWKLIPSLLRSQGPAQLEKELFHEFSRYATRFHEVRRNDWEILFDMQHYWLPTRLLDWSEALGVALAFVLLQEYGEPSDSAVYVLDPVALNRRSGLQTVKSVADDSAFSYRSVYWEHKPFAPQFPIAIDPPFQNDRMFAQRGTFTVHNEPLAALEDQCPQDVRRIVLPKSAKPAAREFIEHANLNELSIFPDLYGLARHIRRRVFGALDADE